MENINQSLSTTLVKKTEVKSFSIKGRTGEFVLRLLLALFAVVQIYPLFWLILFSFKSNGEIFGENIAGLPKALLWENYTRALVTGKVASYLMNSVVVTGVTIIISGILSCMVSYAIARMRWSFSKATLVVFLLGLMVPIHAALLPLFMILRNLKMLNSYWSLIVPYVAFALPMGIYIFVGFIQTLPKELEESAFLDGCNIYRSFFSIILPIIKPAIATVSIFTYLSAWNELMFAITFISKEQFRTLTVGIQQMVGQYTTSWGPIGAGLVIATLPTIVIYILMSSQVQKSLTTGAVKG